jgi:hypothetical protein
LLTSTPRFRHFEEIPHVSQVIIWPDVTSAYSRRFSEGSVARRLLCSTAASILSPMSTTVFMRGEEVGVWILDGMTIVAVEG